MDPEAIVWLVFIGIWFVGGILKQLKQVKEQRPGQAAPNRDAGREAPRPAPRPTPRAKPDDPMIQLLRQLGGQVEARPQKPPPPPPPPPVRPKAVPMAQQVQAARQTRVAEANKQAAQKVASAKRKLQSLASGGKRPGTRAGALTRSLRRQLGDPQSARRAILLQEILGKPPGLQGSPGRR